MLQNDTINTGNIEPLMLISQAGTDAVRDNISVNVRDLPEARAFYESIFGRCEMSSSDSVLRIQLHNQVVVCAHQASLGLNGRVSSRYELVGSRYVPLQHRVMLSNADWQAVADRLSRYDIEHKIYTASDQGEASQESARIAVVDPSGNALEIQAIGPFSRTIRIRRRLQWLVPSAVAIAVAAVLVYGLWQPDESQLDQGNVANVMVAFHHLP